jgi:peptide deformylase
MLDPKALKIVYYPDPVLRQKASPVAGVTDEVRAVAQRMLELMHEARGVGLAAPQVGLSWRLFVANPTGEANDDRVYINPELTQPTRYTDRHEEGCLSIPGVNGQIMRPTGVRIEATGINGEKIVDESEELLARIWQHETDHLDGVLIIDRMTPVDLKAARRGLASLETDYKG